MAAIKGFGRHEDFQVFIVTKDLEGVAGSFKVMAPMSHAFDSGEKLPVMDVVVALSRSAFTRVESNWMPVTIMELAYDIRYRKSRGIGM